MKLTIHRGTNEIGGICIEIQSGKSRILLDFGMPLVNKSGDTFNFKQFENHSIPELISEGVLPDISNAYNTDSDINGVIISHPHADHFGLMKYLSKQIPVYLGKPTHEILKLNNVFIHQENNIEKPIYFEKSKPIKIGEFTVTPYWNDHSAFDAYSFLIEADGKSVFYSGDFRGHGRKAKAYKWFTYNAPKNVDCLLIEGTTIGREAKKFKTEDEIELELVELFKNSDCINYVYTSSQNIDRIVSLYRACLQSGKTFVIDVYTANVLDKLSQYAKLPSPLNSYKRLKVMFPYKLTSGLFRRGMDELANKFSGHKITKEQISEKPSDYVVITRPSMKVDLEKTSVAKGNLIYSMWHGYKKQPSTKEFVNWLKAKNFSVIDIHTSGHADIETLKEYANAINPKSIIPIHTFNKQDYQSIFSQKILQLNDNQVLEV
ncbi:MAG: MBL fold metallo-hydrolase [Carboxylicivirga sp.]|jgi:ribonuclease J|nr:MBL fold metallo-hydrolase [Carboxylicivirga sp.]